MTRHTNHFTQPEWAWGGGINSLVARGSSAAHAADILITEAVR